MPSTGEHDERHAPPLLEMRGMRKSYGRLVALGGVDLRLDRGQVLALLGENGAGKSTLMKILSGNVVADEGEISIDGELRPPHATPAQARDAGIAIVQQELSIVPTLSIAENVFLGGQAPSFLWWPRRLAAAAAPFLEVLGLGDVNPMAPAGVLSVAEQQLLEIARVLARDAKIIIFDEPTATLSDAEIQRVKRVVRRLADDGLGILYVTHRLGEVFEIADKVKVLRDGLGQLEEDVANATMDGLVAAMLGRQLDRLYPERKNTNFGPIVIEADNLLTYGLRTPVSLSIREGEILGFAGQIGSGAPQVLRALAGLQPVSEGQILLDGNAVHHRSLADALQDGVAFCSDDRKRDGTFADRSVTQNLTAPSLRRISRRNWLLRREESDLAKNLATDFQVNVARMLSPVGKLSGGNQQKVALGKWLGVEPRVLLIEEPTRGVDVGARSEIYSLLRRLADEGLAIAFASSDLSEVLGLADTVGTFYRGQLVRLSSVESTDDNQALREVTHDRNVRDDDELTRREMSG